jgi:hypothetical protein
MSRLACRIGVAINMPIEQLGPEEAERKLKAYL